MPNQPRDEDFQTTITLSPERKKLFEDLLSMLQLKKRADWGLTRNQFILQLAEERAQQLMAEMDTD